MSFRSISVLPRCLRGRQASCWIRSRRYCVQCQNYFHSPKPIASSGIDNRIGHLALTVRLSRSRGLQLPFLHVRQLNTKTVTVDERFQTKEVLQLPSSLLDTDDAVVPSSSTIEQEYRPSTDERESQQSFVEDFTEWHTLHDSFLEVRRTRPEQTREIFEKQRKLARQFLGDITDPETSDLTFRTAWSALNSKAKLQLLPSLLIGSLAESAVHCLFVLGHVGPMPQSFLTRMNCLRDIGLMYWKDMQRDPALRRTYKQLIGRLRSPDTWPKKDLPTVLLQNLLFWSTPEQCSIIIRDFSQRYPDAGAASVVAIIDHYLRIGNREEALKCFQGMPESMLRQPDETVKSLVDKLLRLDIVAKSDTGTNFIYLPQLLALGIPPDEALHNAVIESAIANGVPDVAWDLYEYLHTSKFRPDARSHLVLLRDAVQRGDMQRVDKIMTAIHLREDLVRDQYLMAYSMNVVRIISCYDQKLVPQEALSHIMVLYDRAYNRKSLARLGIVSNMDSDVTLPDPPATLLAFTVWTCILIKSRNSEVLHLWEWIKHLIASGDAGTIEAAKFDIIYNGVILFHARKSATLARALEVMQYMLSTKLCLPTSRTWSILLCAYLKHNQVAQAEAVLSLMQQKGFKIQEIDELYSSYIPSGYDLNVLAEQAAAKLDERSMPEGIQDLLAASKSLVRENHG